MRSDSTLHIAKAATCSRNAACPNSLMTTHSPHTRVLIADDHADAAESLSALASADQSHPSGRSCVAFDGLQAVRLATRAPYRDAVITGRIDMPGMNRHRCRVCHPPSTGCAERLALSCRVRKHRPHRSRIDCLRSCLAKADRPQPLAHHSAAIRQRATDGVVPADLVVTRSRPSGSRQRTSAPEQVVAASRQITLGRGRELPPYGHFIDEAQATRNRGSSRQPA